MFLTTIFRAPRIHSPDRVCNGSLYVWYSTGPLKDLVASLRPKTVKLYAEVLRYQMLLAKHYSRPGFFQILRDLVAVDDWKGMLNNVVEQEKTVNDVLETLSNHTLKGIDRKVADLQNDMSKSLSLSLEIRDETKVSNN